MWIRGEIAPEEQFHPFSTIFSEYISSLRSQIIYLFVKFGCSICILSQFCNSDMSKVRISRTVLEGSFDFEITRVDCSCVLLIRANASKVKRILQIYRCINTNEDIYGVSKLHATATYMNTCIHLVCVGRGATLV